MQDENELTLTLLGPVQAWRAGREVDLGTAQQRALLVLLVLHEGRRVGLEEIVGALWGDDAPKGAHGTVRTYVSRLRRLWSREAGAATGRAGLTTGSPLVSVRGGYSLSMDHELVDLLRFEDLLARSRRSRAAGRTADAAALLREGLQLWRGEPLTGIRGDFVENRRNALTELRLSALEECLGDEVDSGRHQDACDQLFSLVARHPLRESLVAVLMRALYRSGRQAEALAAFAQARIRLRDDLGVNAGPALQDLHQRMLRADPALLPPVPAPGPPASISPVPPAQLPPDLTHFVGRTQAVADLSAMVTGPGSPVVMLSGPPGIGTTALAVHVAHRTRSEFPDGQLFAELRTRHDRPRDPHEVLGSLLRALDVGAEDLPSDVNERSALLRTTLSGRRVLIVLDDACDGEQVRPLLPASDGCAVLVTARQRILHLSQARWFPVGPFTPPESLELLGRLAGRSRVMSEPDAAAALAGACSHHPLAVHVAADRLLARPSWSITRIEQQLQEDLMEPVVMADDCAIVDAPLERAERRLSPNLARAFRSLAVPESGLLTPALVARLLDVNTAEAGRLLEALADAHLIETGPSDTYHYLGLLKAYARRRALHVEGYDSCRLLHQRLSEYWFSSSV